MKDKQLRVWWIPQIPMENPFRVYVDSLKEGRIILDTLALYDSFQYDNNIKGDYCNVGGLEIFEDDEWVEWLDEETGLDIDEYFDKF